MACSERYSVSAFVAAWRWSFGRCDIFTGATATVTNGQTASRVLTLVGMGNFSSMCILRCDFRRDMDGSRPELIR